MLLSNMYTTIDNQLCLTPTPTFLPLTPMQVTSIYLHASNSNVSSCIDLSNDDKTDTSLEYVHTKSLSLLKKLKVEKKGKKTMLQSV